MTEERLQKYLARAGVASRRQAEEYIKDGSIKVNGQVITEMGFKLDPAKDKVTVNGKSVQAEEELVYILLNKPPLVITTLQDPQQRTKVTDLLTGVKQRVYPVGRLDYQTEGLLLLTNDGELAHRLTHPSYKVAKTYLVKVKGNLNRETQQMLRDGVTLEDGITQPAQLKVIAEGKGFTRFAITIREGRNRQIRRMCDAVGYSVTSLQRVSFGPLELGDLALGKYRSLTKGEIIALKKACQLI